MPTGPSVLVLPAPGKPLNEFQLEDMTCRQWAAQSIGMTAESANQKAATSAVLGTAIGAGAGALIGAGAGDAAAGAAIGAGSGLLLGSAAGASSTEVSGYEAQRRYDYAYVQCMYVKGNQIPGRVQQYHIQRNPAPPPPPNLDSVPPDYVPGSPPAK
jgi:hypothetical protein